jgi:hypothetical protein
VKYYICSFKILKFIAYNEKNEFFAAPDSSFNGKSSGRRRDVAALADTQVEYF